MDWKTGYVLVLYATVLLRIGCAQNAPPSMLEVDLENYVQYWDDVTDPAKLSSSPGQTTPTVRVFMQNVWVADVVAVNGKPARGTYVNRTQSFGYRPVPAAGQNIADINRNGGPAIDVLEIMMPDGTPVGSVMGIGLVAGAAPPGSPEGLTFGNTAIVGGTGAFLGARGQCGIATGSGVRNASQSEDPSLRRVYGGGKMRMILNVIPMNWPEVRGVYHAADFSPVTPEKPARAGEALVLSVSGLGPVSPNLSPGQPFPPFGERNLHQVNSPVEVTVNGEPVAVANKVGWPTLTNVYRVDFVVPDETVPGMATIGVSVAWIRGPDAKFPVQ